MKIISGSIYSISVFPLRDTLLYDFDNEIKLYCDGSPFNDTKSIVCGGAEIISKGNGTFIAHAFPCDSICSTTLKIFRNKQVVFEQELKLCRETPEMKSRIDKLILSKQK
ncbi:MAG: hypothetical protein HY064_11295 [Bacteroidetes bacterium]|nr:hypothetical protein [Bacteroidota bacterium]